MEMDRSRVPGALGLVVAMLVVAGIPLRGGASVASPAAPAAKPSWTILKPTNTGLPGDYVYSVTVDGADKVWATADDPIWDEGGLTKFDGSVWKDWTNVDGKAPTHDMGNVTVGPDGRMYTASRKGLLVLEGSKVKVLWSKANAPWPVNSVSDFDWDSHGNLWVGLYDVQTVFGGLARYDGTSWTVYTTQNGLPWPEPWDGVSAVEVDDQDRVWIGSAVEGGAVLDGEQWTWLGVQGSWVSDIAIAPDGTPWYGFMSLGVRTWDGSKWVDRTGNFGTADISLVKVDRTGRIWIGTFIGTIWRWSGSGSDWDTKYVVPNLSHVYGLAFDSQNRAWAGGIGGLSVRQPTGQWTVYNTLNTGLPSRWVDDVMVDTSGAPWFSTAGGGLATADPALRFWTDFNPYNWGAAPWPFATDAAEETIEDSQGNIWTLPTFHGVGRWNGEQWTSWFEFGDFTSITEDAAGAIWVTQRYGGPLKRWNGSSWSDVPTPPTGDQLTIEGDAFGNVWLGTAIGLHRYDGSRWTTYNTGNSGLPENWVAAIAVDPSGVVWVGTLGGGLARFDGATWTAYAESNSGIAADYVNAIDIAPNGAIWIGAFDGTNWPYHGGVSSFDGTRWTTYTTKNSMLPHEQVMSVDVDAQGSVWVATASEGAAIIRFGR
jgi:ligand-binding sensor domain-containing protein